MPLRLLITAIALSFLLGGVPAQEAQDSATVAAPLFDTSYTPSPSISARLQRRFLEDIRWSAGVEARNTLTAAFAERTPTEIWLELVEQDGLGPNNVTDALAAYWVLNWITANAAYSAEIDHASIQQQLADAFAQDSAFRSFADQQRQELAEGYILNFLLEHAALNDAVARRDVRTLRLLSAASVARFQQNMGVNLLTLEPGPDGFQPRRPAPASD